VRQQIIVVVSGNRHHGKDALADMLAVLLPDARRDSYAAPLKMCVHLKTGISMEVLNGSLAAKENLVFGRYGKTPRQLMQIEGQTARETYGKTVWMDRAVERAIAAPERITIISDGRHPKEEVFGVQKRLRAGDVVLGVLIRRPSVPVMRGHPSEDKIADEPNETFDVVAINDGDLRDLREKAQQVADLIVLRAKTGLAVPGGFVVTLGGEGRLPEPMVLFEEAEALAAGQNDGSEEKLAEVAQVSYDGILIP